MGRIFLGHIGGARLFSCASCDTILTNRSELISTRFTGATGRAFLFNKAVNLNYSDTQDRVMLTGRHIVRDVTCKNCEAKVGWMYEFATEENQRYKEGKVILERALITESEGFDENPAPVLRTNSSNRDSSSSSTSRGTATANPSAESITTNNEGNGASFSSSRFGRGSGNTSGGRSTRRSGTASSGGADPPNDDHNRHNPRSAASRGGLHERVLEHHHHQEDGGASSTPLSASRFVQDLTLAAGTGSTFSANTDGGEPLPPLGSGSSVGVGTGGINNRLYIGAQVSALFRPSPLLTTLGRTGMLIPREIFNYYGISPFYEDFDDESGNTSTTASASTLLPGASGHGDRREIPLNPSIVTRNNPNVLLHQQPFIGAGFGTAFRRGSGSTPSVTQPHPRRCNPINQQNRYAQTSPSNLSLAATSPGSGLLGTTSSESSGRTSATSHLQRVTTTSSSLPIVVSSVTASSSSATNLHGSGPQRAALHTAAHGNVASGGSSNNGRQIIVGTNIASSSTNTNIYDMPMVDNATTSNVVDTPMIAAPVTELSATTFTSSSVLIGSTTMHPLSSTASSVATTFYQQQLSSSAASSMSLDAHDNSAGSNNLFSPAPFIAGTNPNLAAHQPDSSSTSSSNVFFENTSTLSARPSVPHETSLAANGAGQLSEAAINFSSNNGVILAESNGRLVDPRSIYLPSSVEYAINASSATNGSLPGLRVDNNNHSFTVTNGNNSLALPPYPPDDTGGRPVDDLRRRSATLVAHQHHHHPTPSRVIMRHHPFSTGTSSRHHHAHPHEHHRHHRNCRHHQFLYVANDGNGPLDVRRNHEHDDNPTFAQSAAAATSALSIVGPPPTRHHGTGTPSFESHQRHLHSHPYHHSHHRHHHHYHCPGHHHHSSHRLPRYNLPASRTLAQGPNDGNNLNNISHEANLTSDYHENRVSEPRPYELEEGEEHTHHSDSTISSATSGTSNSNALLVSSDSIDSTYEGTLAGPYPPPILPASHLAVDSAASSAFGALFLGTERSVSRTNLEGRRDIPDRHSPNTSVSLNTTGMATNIPTAIFDSFNNNAAVVGSEESMNVSEDLIDLGESSSMSNN